MNLKLYNNPKTHNLYTIVKQLILIVISLIITSNFHFELINNPTIHPKNHQNPIL